ncbi:hypothetical protein MTO96_001016 [Rhipicephalus appendiculatus]
MPKRHKQNRLYTPGVPSAQQADKVPGFRRLELGPSSLCCVVPRYAGHELHKALAGPQARVLRGSRRLARLTDAPDNRRRCAKRGRAHVTPRDVRMRRCASDAGSPYDRLL